MSNQLMSILACFLLMTSMWSGCNALPRLTSRQMTGAANGPASDVNEDVCKNYMEGCVPWETKCCSQMACVNLARGYCLYPWEKCWCQKPYTVDLY